MIFKASCMAHASADKIDELSGSRLTRSVAPDMAAAATADPAFEPSV